mgnify:CR=1 FL=1
MIVGLSVVGNESDVIEAFVRHNLQYLDRIEIITHRPIDGTAEILRALASEGLPLVVHIAKYPGFRQGEENTEVAKQILANSELVSHIVLLDADEFIVAPTYDFLRQVLPMALPHTNPGFSWRSYVPILPQPPHASHLHSWIIHRRVTETVPIYKIVLTRRFLDDNRLVAEGSHWELYREGESIHGQPYISWIREVSLAHFPVRSVTQLTNKVLIGCWNRRIDSTQSQTQAASHWQAIYDNLSKGIEITTENLSTIGYNYANLSQPEAFSKESLVEDPIPRTAVLRYGHLSHTKKGQLLIRWVESLIDSRRRDHE